MSWSVQNYAKLFEHWIGQDPTAAANVLTTMLAQRVALGLAQDRKLDFVNLADVIPVIAVGLPVKNEPAARPRARDLQELLRTRELGSPNLAVVGVNPDGTTAPLEWL